MRLWEAYAIRYASAVRAAHSNFVDPAGIADVPMPIDFFVWLLRSGDQAILVDTGFDAATGGRRNRRVDCPPDEAIRRLGLAPHGIGDVIVTHMHYDHAGNLPAFDGATIHVQAQEIGFVTGTPMHDRGQRHFFEAKDVAAAIEALYADRVRFHDGDGEVADGVTVHLVGGHTAGLQVVRVRTARGWIVLASDASHFYANMLLANPFPAIWDRAALDRAVTRVGLLADSPAHIVPGHDPEVLRLYPRLANAAGIDVACLHAAPAGAPATAHLIQRDEVGGHS